MKTFSYEYLEKSGLTKGEMIEEVYGEKFPSGVDTALPQPWLDEAALLSKYSYHDILSTCVWDKGTIRCFCTEIAKDLKKHGCI